MCKGGDTNTVLYTVLDHYSIDTVFKLYCTLNLFYFYCNL